MAPVTQEYVLDSVGDRTLLLRIRPSRPEGYVDFVEQHSGLHLGWRGDARKYAVTAKLGDVEPLVALLEARLRTRSAGGDIPDRLAAALTGLVRQGDLDDALPPMSARERVAGWFGEAGVPYQRNTWLPSFDLAPGLTLRFNLSGPERVTIMEEDGEHRTFEVTTEWQSIDRVISHLEQRFGKVSHAGHPGDRMNHFAVVLAKLVEDGRIGAPLPAGASTGQIATWYAEAGVAHQRSSERRHPLLRTYRGHVGCSFGLTLGISSRDNWIWFAEDYEYFSRPGDAGREYSYSVRTPYASLDQLVTFFATWLRLDIGGNPEDRLIASFEELVRRGDLFGSVGISQNRDRVASWFSDAGVPAEPGFWAWIDSD